PTGQAKITPDLRQLLANQVEAANLVRMDVILASTPTELDRSWMKGLSQAAPDLVIEGRLGPLVAVRGLPKMAIELANLPIVPTIRLPVVGRSMVFAAGSGAGNAKQALEASGLERLHRLRYRGKGVRLAVVDGDFRGWEGLKGKQLPAS